MTPFAIGWTKFDDGQPGIDTAYQLCCPHLNPAVRRILRIAHKVADDNVSPTQDWERFVPASLKE